MTPYYVAAIVFFAISVGLTIGALIMLAIHDARCPRRRTLKES